MTDTFTPPERIGFIGLGKMGAPMIRNLKKAGFELALNDIDLKLARTLSDEVGAPSATMHGFVNLMLATATVGERLPTTTAAALLTRTDHSALVFDDERVRWGDVELSIDAIGRMREAQCVSFGACSFREPADEYRRFDLSHAFAPRG